MSVVVYHTDSQIIAYTSAQGQRCVRVTFDDQEACMALDAIRASGVQLWKILSFGDLGTAQAEELIELFNALAMMDVASRKSDRHWQSRGERLLALGSTILN